MEEYEYYYELWNYDINFIKAAGMLQHYYKSDHPPVTKVTEMLWGDILDKREKEGRKTYKGERQKDYVRRMSISLHVASFLDNPWQSISLNKNDYVKDTRNRKLFLKYRPFYSVINDLIDLGYIDAFDGDNYHINITTRIRATPKLLELMKEYELSEVMHDFSYTPDPVRLKDNDGKFVEYKDTKYTKDVREKLLVINSLYDKTRVTVKLHGINPINKLSYRTYIDSSFDVHGRMYNGLIQQLKSEQRNLIRINGEEVTELDFKALHPTMLYLQAGLTPPDEPYKVDGYTRNKVKMATICMINGSKEELTDTSKPFFFDVQLLDALEKIHKPIAHKFYNRDVGQRLMWQDGTLSMNIVYDLAEKGIPCFSVHDSFIVARQHEELLRYTMTKYFMFMFGSKPTIDKEY